MFMYENMDIQDGFTTSSKEQLRSRVRVYELDEITFNGGKDRSVTKEHLLTQNLHSTSSTQQAEQASFTREQIPRRARQFSLKINKRQSS
jgi:hypothetical protein